jgi:hypothetical protein
LNPSSYFLGRPLFVTNQEPCAEKKDGIPFNGRKFIKQITYILHRLLQNYFENIY